MSSATGTMPAGAPKGWMIWTGRVLSAIPALFLIGLGTMGLVLRHSPQMVDGMQHFGYPPSKIVPLCAIEICTAVLYAVPRTAVLGAILVTGYLGGAVATHVRIGDPGYPMALIVASLAWAGLWLRDERVRALFPLRRPR